MSSYGETSQFRLVIAKKGGKTVVEDAFFTAPFKLTAPFYDEDGRIRLMPISVSAGILEGDVQDISITVKGGATAEILSQSYEKIHRMRGGFARRKCHLKVEDAATLFYTPLPCIPFENSAFESEIAVSLEGENSRLFLSDVIACGRTGHGERFAFSRYESAVSVQCGDKLIYLDKTRLDPQKFDLESYGFFEGFTHLAAVFIANFPDSDKHLSSIREILAQKPEIQGGASLTHFGDISVKLLGASAQILTEIVEEIKGIFE